MILQCPACDARFLVGDSAIPPEGRDVRCGRCKHSWLARPAIAAGEIPVIPESKPEPAFATFEHALASATSEEADRMAESVVRDTRLPTVQKTPFDAKPFRRATAALALLLFVLAPFMYYPQLKSTPPFTLIYSMFGWHNSEGLVFSDVQFKHEEDGPKSRYYISGNIINHAKKNRTVDEVRVTLKTGEGETIWSREYAVDKDLPPDGIYPFEITNVETTFGDRVKTVMMDIGNSYELTIR